MAASSCRRGGKIINRIDPSSQLFFTEYDYYAVKFEQCGWLVFCQKLQGHDANITLAFSQGFDGKTTKIGDLMIEVTKASIAASIDLPCTGERWFKNKTVQAIDCNSFLVDGHQEPDWSKEIPRRWVRPRYKDPLMEVQNFITCEGRYGITLLYHMRFLLHFHSDQPLNLPFFLLKSLTKMEFKVQHHPTNLANSLFHHGLVKILVEAHLKSWRKTWDRFLYRYGFSATEPIGFASTQTSSHEGIVDLSFLDPQALCPHPCKITMIQFHLLRLKRPCPVQPTMNPQLHPSPCQLTNQLIS